MTDYESTSLVFYMIQSLILVGGFIAAWRQLRELTRANKNGLELSSRQNAMDLIARYSEPQFIDRRIKLRTETTSQENSYECWYTLNFFEELAIAVKHKTANEDLVKDYFGSVLRIWMEQDYMVTALRKATKDQDSAAFENLIDLYTRWESDRSKALKINSIAGLER